MELVITYEEILMFFVIKFRHITFNLGVIMPESKALEIDSSLLRPGVLSKVITHRKHLKVTLKECDLVMLSVQYGDGPLFMATSVEGRITPDPFNIMEGIPGKKFDTFDEMLDGIEQKLNAIPEGMELLSML